MPDANDMELMQEYAGRNSERAFAELVHRHINLVYSVALRFTGDSGDAQDVTQAVFIILAQKAAGLRHRTSLTGWLYETTRLTARQSLRTRIRRQAREQEAYMQSTLDEAGNSAVWEKLSPHLETAMSKLAERDRALLVLRFYENKSGPEAAALLGIREDAAHKRVTRAIEKLRKFFAQRGVTLTATAIAGAVSANSVQAAPVVLAKTVTAVAVVKGSIATASTLTLVKGTIKMMTSTKIFTAAAILTSAIFSQEMVASHFGLSGQANAWMPRSTYLMLSIVVGIGLPVFIIVSGYVLRFIADDTLNIPHRDYWLAPERRDETFDYIFRYFLRLACLEAVFLVGFQLLIVHANHQTPPHLSMPLVWGLLGCLLTIFAVLQIAVYRHFKRGAHEQ